LTLATTTSFAKQTECNKVPITVSANPVFYADKTKNEAEQAYASALKSESLEDQVVKLKEAHLKFQAAYKTISDDRANIAAEIFKKQCPNTPTLYKTPEQDPSK
jgi:hypothetical protein